MSISQSHGHMFELTIEIVLFITFRRKKTYVQDVLDDVVSDVSKRTVQKYLASLEKLGYITGDKNTHKDSCQPKKLNNYLRLVHDWNPLERKTVRSSLE